MTNNFDKYELTLVSKDGHGDIVSIDKIKDDSLTRLLSQFLLVIVRVTEKQVELNNTNRVDDDIPF